MTATEIEIAEMCAADARAVARLHAETITEGFLLKLGLRFLAALYRGIADDDKCKVWVARRKEKVIGFCAYTRTVGGMYRRVLRRRWLHLGFASLPYSLNPFTLKEMLDTLRYPSKQTDAELPECELLSIGIDAAGRGTGIGRRLLDRAVRQAAADGCAEIKVLAGAALEGANKFYQACGFEKRATIEQHGEPLNVYVVSCDEYCSRETQPLADETRSNREVNPA